MPARRDQYLERLGLVRWQLREQTVPPAEAPIASTTAAADAASPVVAAPVEPSARPASWQALEAQVSACTACELHQTRTQTVFGVGNREADWMIIGEAPGAEDDRQGEPFVGRAGNLLDNMLRAAGLQRNDVFIANILKCRPPDNRDPHPEEVVSCAAFLQRQIEWVGPKLILCVGRVAAQNLLQTGESIGSLRGRVHRLASTHTPVVVTYHPAYLLRKPSEKRKAWDDLKLAMSLSRERARAGGTP